MATCEAYYAGIIKDPQSAIACNPCVNACVAGNEAAAQACWSSCMGDTHCMCACFAGTEKGAVAFMCVAMKCQTECNL
jgi:hypothetical protein